MSSINGQETIVGLLALKSSGDLSAKSAVRLAVLALLPAVTAALVSLVDVAFSTSTSSHGLVNGKPIQQTFALSVVFSLIAVFSPAFTIAVHSGRKHVVKGPQSDTEVEITQHLQALQITITELRSEVAQLRSQLPTAYSS